jgi:mRNA-degrading endonuclease toxin of MazEF toxin-antitoxin module
VGQFDFSVARELTEDMRKGREYSRPFALTVPNHAPPDLATPCLAVPCHVGKAIMALAGTPVNRRAASLDAGMPRVKALAHLIRTIARSALGERVKADWHGC